MTWKVFTCAEDHFERRMIKLLINFSRFCLEIVGQCCVVIRITFSGFCEGKIFWKKVVFLNFEWKNIGNCCRNRKLRVRGSFWSKNKKQEAVIYFGYRAKILQLLLSKVQSNCPESFVVTIIEGLQMFFRNCRLIFDDWSVRITFQVCRGTFCGKKTFLWNLSWEGSEDVVESEFHVCRDMLWEKISHAFEDTFLGWWTKVLSTCRGEHLWEVFPKNSSLVELVSLEIWLVLSELFSTGAWERFCKRKFLKPM